MTTEQLIAKATETTPLPFDAPEQFACYLVTRREALGLSQTELAERLGCAVRTLSRWETHECYPAPAVFKHLAHHLEPENRGKDDTRGALHTIARLALAADREKQIGFKQKERQQDWSDRQVAKAYLHNYRTTSRTSWAGDGKSYSHAQNFKALEALFAARTPGCWTRRTPGANDTARPYVFPADGSAPHLAEPELSWAEWNAKWPDDKVALKAE